MSFHEVLFPSNINYGSLGGPGFNTAIVETDSGKEERIARWSVPRRKYDAAYQIKSKEDIAELLKFYIARQGPAFGFRYKDWADFTTASDHRSAHTATDVDIAVGDGSKTQFQLIKKYTSGGVTRTRNITKPVSGAVKVGINGVEQGSGWTVNTASGIVTFTTAPASGATVQAGCEFDVPVRFDKSLDDMIGVAYDNFDSQSIDSIPLVEIVDETEVAEEFFYGGAKAHGSISASITLSLQDGRVHSMNPQVTGLSVNLPNPVANGIPLGGPHFYITNGGPQSISLKDHNGGTIKVIANGEFTTVVLGLNSSGTKTWYAHG